MPFYRTTIETPRHPSDVQERLAALVGPERSVWEVPTPRNSDPERRPFEGTLSADSFRIQRDIAYRNSFLPVIRGRIESGPVGTRIALRMTVHPVVIAFGIVWLAAVGAFAVGANSSLAIGALVFSVLLGSVPFYAEALAAASTLRRELGTPDHSVRTNDR